jgi:hypothetical protein
MLPFTQTLKMPASSTELLANELTFFYEFLNLI